MKRSALSGFYLLNEWTGWDRVLVVDAVRTGQHPPGTVLSFPFEALGTEEGPSPHAVGLPTVIRLGRRSGVPLPSHDGHPELVPACSPRHDGTRRCDHARWSERLTRPRIRY